MLDALGKLGVSLSFEKDTASCRIVGCDGGFPVEQADLYLGNAGTVMRPLCAMLAFQSGTFSLSGEPRMCERPIADLVNALKGLGAKIIYDGKEGYPPVRILPSEITSRRAIVEGGVSSQFLSALLMAAPLTPEGVAVDVNGDLVSKPYVEITLKMMEMFGVPARNDHYRRLEVGKGSSYRSPGRLAVEGDATAATYFLSAAAIRGGTVTVKGVGFESIQGDSLYADVLEKMGAVVEKGPGWIRVTGGELRGIDIDMNHMPDAAMTLAATALFAGGKTGIRNIANLRVKESDRITALSNELRKVGAGVEEGGDYLVIDPPDEIREAEIDTYNDHRIAMAMSLAALGKSAIKIKNPECTSKTFPEYFTEFRKIIQ